MYSILPVLCMYCTVYVINTPQLNQQIGSDNGMTINNQIVGRDSLQMQILVFPDTIYNKPLQESRMRIDIPTR